MSAPAYGNLLVSQTDPRGNTTSYTYGNSISMMTGQPTKVTDALGHVTNTTYNTSNGRVNGSSTTGVSLAYTYGNGMLTEMTRTVGSSSQTYAMTYNYWNRLRTVRVGDYLLATYTYTSNNGQLNKLLYGNGQYETYSYDELERITDIRYNNGGSTFDGVSYTYTGEGTLGTLTDHANSRIYNYSYDNLYRLTGMTETYNNHSVLTYLASYDNASRISGYSYNFYPSWSGSTNWTRSYSFSYDSDDGSLISMSAPFAGYSLNYDSLKRLSSIPVLNFNNAALMTRSYTYLAGAATNETTTLVSTYKVKKPTSGNFASYTYSYDALGNITGISGSTTASYTYDALNQLTSATQDGVTYSYTYNKAGNILSKTVNNGTPITYTYGDANGWKDLLTGYNGHTISYDAIGNPTTWYDNAQMSWVNGRRLESISAVSGVHSAMSFTYNSDGLRLTKTVGTGNSAVEHRYTWQGGNLISEYWGDGKRLEFYYGPDGSIDSFGYRTSTNGSFYVYYYVKNLQGDVVAIINKDGELRAQYTYDPFGKVLSATGTMADINPIRYRGYYYDAELGFYYLQSRYYDPNICRFINADGLASTGQGFIGCNMFAYCNNNPVNEIDPDGENSLAGFADPNMSVVDNARPWESAVLALGLLAGAILAHETGKELGRYLLAELSKQSSSSTPAVKVSVSSPAPPPGPNKPNNDRKFNVRKNESPEWNKLDRVKNSKLRTSGSGSQQRYYDWDYTHNDIEVYNYRGDHLGSMDPVTGEIYKPPIAGRNIRALLH